MMTKSKMFQTVSLSDSTNTSSSTHETQLRQAPLVVPSPLNMPEFVPYVCHQYEAPFEVSLVTKTQEDYKIEEKTKKRGIPPAARPPSLETTTGGMESSGPTPPLPEDNDDDDSHEIVLYAVLDAHARLVHLMFHRCKELPRMLFQVIGMCVPFYPTLHRITVRWGSLTAVVLYEMSKFLEYNLTEICLDDSPVKGRNYQVLLERTSNLHYLSLSRCNLDDHDCINIMKLLAYPLPASKTLIILTLDSNRIGDGGACAVGEVLRSNRGLQHVNLAGNHITDRGAISILKSLMEFPMTHEELQGKKWRYIDYLKQRKEMYVQCIKELTDAKSHDDVRTARRRTVLRLQKKFSSSSRLTFGEALCQRAEALTTERIGAFNDPFSSRQTVARAGHIYCFGNMTLCSLNLSYNNLQYGTITTLYDVMMHQSWHASRDQSGLLRVIIEGNEFPLYCEELEHIDELVERALITKLKHLLGRRPSERGRLGRQNRLKV